MAYFAPYLIGGLAAVLALDYVPSVSKALGSSAPASFWSDAAPASHAERSQKGDRLAAPRPLDVQSEIAAVEVVGLRSAAIVYRDRDGRELFRTDPQSNVTTVSKGVTLPEVTIRRHAGSPVRTVPVDVREQASDQGRNDQTQSSRKANPQRKVPVGCEPSFSPVAQPQLAHHTGRCMAQLAAPVQLAMR